MNQDIRKELTRFYKRCRIYPKDFKCPHQDLCQQYAYQQDMTEAKMSMVGSLYGKNYPKIVVVSLDPPKGKGDDFKRREQRTSESIAKHHEAEHYCKTHPNRHWAFTQILVKDILVVWGYQAQPNSAIVTESYEKRPIENVSKYFSHVNVAKCSMNKPDQRQARQKVHWKCSSSYLFEELEILQPDLLISQGVNANKNLGRLFGIKITNNKDLPKSEVVKLGQKQCLWLPMRHPSSNQLGTIRKEWTEYLNYINNWKQVNKI
ncbi:MAG: hypothetical protein K8R40_10355 [Anaerolineaceae bacterium]|nr:hypothetical protein [Anaerolineaceae bacterium]